MNACSSRRWNELNTYSREKPLSVPQKLIYPTRRLIGTTINTRRALRFSLRLVLSQFPLDKKYRYIYYTHATSERYRINRPSELTSKPRTAAAAEPNKSAVWELVVNRRAREPLCTSAWYKDACARCGAPRWWWRGLRTDYRCVKGLLHTTRGALDR